ncbi:MAG TPA: hypothetical protein VGD77_05590 [Gemmatimonadaceae bacterium]
MHANVLLLAALLTAPAPAPTAPQLLDTAIARMGGPAALAAVKSVRYEMLTQWQRLSFDPSPYTDRPSYERHAELRDYAAGAWRNTRQFPVGASWREITDIVVDSVAARRSGTGPWAPLASAYVDERREVFAFAAERLLPAARAAADLRALGDTTIAGVRYARVAATVSGIPATLHLRARDGMLAMVHYRAAQPKDFGLAPWGAMEVEWWYSGWQQTAAGVALPTQLDVRRVGRPYKRMSVLLATVNAPAPVDSFAVSDSLRVAFRRGPSALAMYDLPLDSAKRVAPRVVSFATPGAPAGAVKLGRSWLLLEAGTAPLSIERAAGWLARADSGAVVTGAVLSAAAYPQGGLPWLLSRRAPLYVAPGAAPVAAAVAQGHDVAPPAPASVVSRGRWLRLDGDSAWIEPVDLPDAPGALLVYVPSLEWAYSAMAMSPPHQRPIEAILRARGWPVTRIGNARVPWPAVK